MERSNINMAYKYFLFSKQQQDFRTNLDAKVGKRFKTGYVIVNGRRRIITEISSTSTNRFTDTKVIAEGEENNFDYQKPSSI